LRVVDDTGAISASIQRRSDHTGRTPDLLNARESIDRSVPVTIQTGSQRRWST